VPPAAEGRTAGLPGGTGLASTPSLGPDGPRAAPTEDTGVSAAEIVFSLPLVLPGQILDMEEPPQADFIAKLRQSSAAFTPPLLRADGGQASGSAALGGVCVHPEGWHGSPLVSALQRPVQGPRLIPKGVPAAGGRAGRDGLH
jgi:hypothetical protein